VIRKSEIYAILDAAIRNPESAEAHAALRGLRDSLAPGPLSHVVVEVKGPKGTSTTESMSLRKAEKKAAWFKSSGITVRILPAPPKQRRGK